MTWINVKDGLPEEHCKVLLYDGEDIAIGYRYLYNPIMIWSTNDDWFGTPIHWMPLPDLPNENQ